SKFDAFRHVLASGVTERISVDSAGKQGNGHSTCTSVSADGRVFAFDSNANNLTTKDTNGKYDSFVHELCSTTATWVNYGAGYPGTNGIPPLTSQQFPSFGASVTIVAGNSYGAPTFGLLFVGVQRASIPTRFGGDLLVAPWFATPISFSYGADSFTGDIPDDVALCAATIDVQVVEQDPGATYGVSFTAGPELLIRTHGESGLYDPQ